MAAAIGATLFPNCTTTTAIQLLPPIRSSLTLVPKLPRRRNYLRRKLLKTLPKPKPKPSPDTITLPQPPLEEHQIGTPEFEFEKADAAEEPEASSSDLKAPEFVQISIPNSESGGLGRVSTRNVVKFGACFVGVFVLQAVVRALIRGSGDDRGELGFNGDNSGLGETIEVRDEGVLYVNEAEMEERIAEIRVMAKEAKEREKRNLERGDFGESDDGDSDNEDEIEARSGIEREIDNRMIQVRRRGLGNGSKSLRVMNVDSVNKPKQDAEKGKGDFLGDTEENEKLMFEKKLKFRNGDSSKHREKPEGFQGSVWAARKGSVNGKDNGVLRNGPRVDLGNNADLKTDVSKMVKGGKTEFAGKHVVPQSNGTSTARIIESSRSKSKSAGKEAADSSGPWWLKLPYIFAIGMHQGYEDEVEPGLYSLNTASDGPSPTHESYTVLFEDRADANNFCRLLEMYLEDMSIFVVPFPTNELNDKVKSQKKNMIAVRKGQLRLYAGQPLHEVETALRLLV